MFEAYLQLCIVSLINISIQPPKTIGELINYSFAIFQLVLIVAFPIALYVYFKKNIEKLLEKEFLESVGEVIDVY